MSSLEVKRHWKLQKADGVEEDDEDGHRRNVAYKCLPSKIESGVGNFEFGFGTFGRHEPAGKEGNEDAT